ncbi:MAG: PLP-dependent aminotransferase family protein [Chitinispirillaceae bacterium]|nr:PLP-dependent aminotransferase family protein [Chitinispirillaceae bacterium]
MLDLSTSAKNMRSSEIRELMKLAADPSIISFAGGMPGSDCLPVTLIDELYASLSIREKQAALQYGPTTGYPPLLESLASHLASKGIDMADQSVIVTTGGQQAINLITRVLIDPGDRVITEDPCFIGALAAFLSYQAHLAGVPLDAEGMMTGPLQETIEKRYESIKMIYLNPSFQNPSGIMYSRKRKADLLGILKKSHFCLVEDDPYAELYFDETNPPDTTPFKALADDAFPVCYIGSFAKIFGPGLRLGWLCGPRAIIEKCELAKQSMDACSSSLSQVIAHQYLSRGLMPGFLSSLRARYAKRARVMLEALDATMPEGVSWTRPQGGFYVWVTLPGSVNATDLFRESIKQGAAFVTGNAFDPGGTTNNRFRLAFSHTPEDTIAGGIQIIASSLRELL